LIVIGPCENHVLAKISGSVGGDISHASCVVDNEWYRLRSRGPMSACSLCKGSQWEREWVINKSPKTVRTSAIDLPGRIDYEYYWLVPSRKWYSWWCCMHSHSSDYTNIPLKPRTWWYTQLDLYPDLDLLILLGQIRFLSTNTNTLRLGRPLLLGSNSFLSFRLYRQLEPIPRSDSLPLPLSSHLFRPHQHFPPLLPSLHPLLPLPIQTRIPSLIHHRHRQRNHVSF
jgi:hypothetical protein